jgi:hypothetical protein
VDKHKPQGTRGQKQATSNEVSFCAKKGGKNSNKIG